MAFKQNFYLYYFLSFFIFPLGFFIRMLYSKTLSIGEFGLIYSIISFFSLISIFVQFGLNQSILYFIPKFYIKKDLDKIRNSLYMIICFVFTLILVLGLLIYLFKFSLASLYFKSDLFSTYILYFLIFFLGNNLLGPISNFYLSMGKIVYSQILYFFQNLLILIFSLSIFLLHFKNLFQGYVFFWFCIPFFIAIFYFILLFFKYPFLLEKIPVFDFKLFSELFRYGFYGIMSTLGNLILGQIDILLITYFLTLTDVAFYSNALAIVNILFLITVPVSILFLGEVSKLKEDKNIKLIKFYLEKLYSYGIFLLLPFILIFYLFSDLILQLLFSIEFIGASSILSVLVLFSIFKIFFQYNLNFLNGLGLIKLTTKIILFVASFNFIFDLIVIKYFGLRGVALITGFGWFLIFILTLYYLIKELNWKINFLFFIKILFLNFILFFSLQFSRNYLFFTNFYLNSGFILIINFTLYFILGYLLKIWSFEEILMFLPNNLQEIFIAYQKRYFSFLK